MWHSLNAHLVKIARKGACAAFALSLGLAAAAPAHATDFVFDFVNKSFVNSATDKQTFSLNGTGNGNTALINRTVDGQSLQAQLSAWSIDTRYNPDRTFNAILNFYSGGIGIDNRVEPNRSPDHAIDNDADGTDFLVLQFSKPVNLSGIKLGWIYGDSDATIRWGDAPGAWNAVPLLHNVSVDAANGLNNMLDPTIVSAPGDYNDYGSRVTPNGGVSDFWIISAANPNLNDGSSRSPNYISDYFKLAAITVSEYPPLPEPGTWITMILGFGVIGGMMRRQRKSTGQPNKLASA